MPNWNTTFYYQIKKSPLLVKIKFEPTFFQVLWQFFNPKGSLLRAGERGVLGEFRPPSPDAISVRIFSNRHRQLVKEEFGSPATRARQPIFGSKSNFLPLFREAERQKRAFLNFNLLGI